ncbi:dihydrolipoyl dehydrogenase [Alkalihalobacillus sp. CinArs1]|uniref:dihydrolipoyl dehydrogenase n=1 Tax=Alkalihalobacillus sp. CinArs1 TaxID=2995314 RepID=UPI0022DD38F2|nr:dihydrolipoyl dehydrogenase [Alkalihalobacillus sp. CinArs1]
MTAPYDITVIGGGPGGYVAALHAAEQGKRVALIEAKYLGGTCLNWGCIPSKTYLKQAEIIEMIKKARDWGIETGEIKLSIDKMKRRKDEVIHRLRNGISYLLKQGKIDVFYGYGTIEKNHSITIKTKDDVHTIESEKIIVATGSRPVVPSIQGLEQVDYDTSDTIFDMKNIPSSIAIIGGGVIGVEFACIFASLGTEVTVVEMADRIIPNEDADASKTLTKELENKGVSILTGSTVKKVTKVTKENNYSILSVMDGNGETHSLEAQSLLVSVGRKPNTSAVEKLELEKNGPFIHVNEKMETTNKGIYAIGDVIGGYQLAHVASAEGIVAANNAMNVDDQFDDKVIPRCIYTLPEVASVGMTEEEVVNAGISYRTERFELHANGKALSAGEAVGFSKIICDETYGEILGVTLVGAHVTELISEASAFMSLEGTIEEAAKMIHPHPTVSEAFQENASSLFQKLKNQGVLV